MVAFAALPENRVFICRTVLCRLSVLIGRGIMPWNRGCCKQQSTNPLWQAGEGWEAAASSSEYWEPAAADGYTNGAGEAHAEGYAGEYAYGDAYGGEASYGAGEGPYNAGTGFGAEASYGADCAMNYGAEGAYGGADGYGNGYGSGTGAYGGDALQGGAGGGGGIGGGGKHQGGAGPRANGNGHVVVAREGPTVVVVKTKGKRRHDVPFAAISRACV